MKIAGEVRSVKVGRKIDTNNREITILDFRVELVDGMGYKQPLIDLTGKMATVEITKAQMTLEDAG